MRSLFERRFPTTERGEFGATATEYAMLIATIALILVLAAAFFGSALSSWFTGLGNTVSTGF